jgi:hypothetical protein
MSSAETGIVTAVVLAAMKPLRDLAVHQYGAEVAEVRLVVPRTLIKAKMPEPTVPVVVVAIMVVIHQMKVVMVSMVLSW